MNQVPDLVERHLLGLGGGIGLAAESMALAEFVVRAAKRIREWQGTVEAQRRRDQRDRGVRRLRANRSAVGALLLDYYAANPSDRVIDGPIFVPTLLGAGGRELALPLVSLGFLENFGPASYAADYLGHHGSWGLQQAPSQGDLEKAAADWSLFGIEVEDNPIYSLSAVKAFNKYSFTLSRYGVYRATYGALEDELHLALGGSNDEDWPQVAQHARDNLERRARLLPTVESIVDCGNRLNAGGALALLVARGSQQGEYQYWYLVQRRALKVADEPGSLTVAPKAVHQHVVHPELEVPLPNTLWRELDEELFAEAGREKRPDKGVVAWDWFAEGSPLVRKLLDDEVEYQLVHTGVVWDLVKGNYHACYLIYVADTQWFSDARRRMRLNWEFATDIPPLNRLPGENLSNFLWSDDWAPESHYCFLRGLNWLATNVPGLRSISQQLPGLLQKPFDTLRHSGD